MSNKTNSAKTFLEQVAPWIRGYQIAVYLKGRAAPATGITVCSVQPGVLIGRWKNSTHLFPVDAINYIRFAPDCDPCRDPAHPLHGLVQCHRPGDRRGQPPAKDYVRHKPDTEPVGAIIKDLLNRKDNQSYVS